MQTPFKFNLGQQARIAVSGETGEVTGRAEYTTIENTYYLRYKSADGRAVQTWWDESALESAERQQPACLTCEGRTLYREPYSAEFTTCPDCGGRPNSHASATTDASVNPGDSKA